MNKSLEEQSDKILKAIKALGPGWHGRSEIAAQLGKKRLFAAEATLLSYLVETGKVEAEQHEIEANIPIRWEYRIREDKHEK